MRSPTYQALNRPKTIKGVDYQIVISLLLIGVGLGLFSTAFLWFLFGYPVLIIVFIILKEANKKEPLLLNIYKRYMRQGDVYEPWPVLNPKRGFRPIGFGQTKWLK